MMKYFFLAGYVKYSHSDGNAKTMSILSDGYWSAVTSDKLCDQTAIRIGKGVPKGMLRSADMVCECLFV